MILPPYSPSGSVQFELEFYYIRIVAKLKYTKVTNTISRPTTPYQTLNTKGKINNTKKNKNDNL